MIKDLKQASKKNEAPIWSRLADLALKQSSRKVVNLARINTATKENDVLFVPSKVLGTGNISHKITLCSFSISTSAANKIIQNGGKIMTYSDMIKKYPTGMHHANHCFPTFLLEFWQRNLGKVAFSKLNLRRMSTLLANSTPQR